MRSRQVKLLTLVALSTILIPLLTFIVFNETSVFDGYRIDYILIIIILITTFYVIYSYLEGGSEISKNTADLQSKLDSLKEQLDSSFGNIVKDGLTVENLESIISNQIQNQYQDEIIENIKKSYETEITDNIKLKGVKLELEELVNHISKYIDRLTRASSINLTIGAITTLIAVFTLIFFLNSTQVSFNNISDFLSYYTPRISIAIFIEVFSFFFLKLYKANQNDIKYFENERTNINSKILALKFSFLTDNDKSLNIILAQLAATERNFKLNKDESTVNLEKMKIEKEENENIIVLLRKLIKISE